MPKSEYHYIHDWANYVLAVKEAKSDAFADCAVQAPEMVIT